MIDLHELAQLPHGEARKVLIKKGLWDEYAGMPEKEFDVYIEYVVPMEDEYTIKERHRDEAIEMAEDSLPAGAEIGEFTIDGEDV